MGHRTSSWPTSLSTGAHLMLALVQHVLAGQVEPEFDHLRLKLPETPRTQDELLVQGAPLRAGRGKCRFVC